VRRFEYRIFLVSSAGAIAREARISPGDGWRLFAPGEGEWGLWDGLLTAGWMAVLLGPLGYLASQRSRATAAIAAVGAALTVLLLPVLTGCAWLPVAGWCGLGGGLLIGPLSRARSGRASG